MVFHVDSPAATERIGHAIGARLRGGEVIELSSDLGGGKTTFVRGLAAGMGSDDAVASPTFVISREYRGKGLTLHHYDFYRLERDAGIMADELRDVLDDDNAVCVIEWSGSVARILPDTKLTITFERTGDESRALRCEVPDALKYLFEETR